jgi:hypothetical protein
MTNVETLQQAHAELWGFRAEMGDAWPTPDTLDALRFAVTEAGEALDAWMRARFGLSTGLWLSGTLTALLFAYLVRFLAVSLQTVESGLGKIKPAMDESARSMGMRPGEVLRRVHMPMLRGSPADNSAVEFAQPMIEGWLEGDSRSWSVARARTVGLQFTVIEG